jgi:hypothetical protein
MKHHACEWEVHQQGPPGSHHVLGGAAAAGATARQIIGGLEAFGTEKPMHAMNHATNLAKCCVSAPGH